MPTLLLPPGRQLIEQAGYAFTLAVGEQVLDTDFSVTPPVEVRDDVAAGQTVIQAATHTGGIRLVKQGAGRLVLD